MLINNKRYWITVHHYHAVANTVFHSDKENSYLVDGICIFRSVDTQLGLGI